MHSIGNHPDYIVLKPAPDVDIGSMAGEWIDRRQTPNIHVAVEIHGCRLVPTPDLECAYDGSVAQVFLIEKNR
jgi:hypothetical protein